MPAQDAFKRSLKTEGLPLSKGGTNGAARPAGDVQMLCQDDGPWFVKQSFSRAESLWLCPLLGTYFPSLPRVLDLSNEGTQIHVMMGTAPGESVKAYCHRLGALPVGIACVLVWRLAAELEALESFLPEAASFVDPLASRVGLWQREFLQLFVDRFETRPLRRADTAANLLRLCLMLINGHSSAAISDIAAARIPSSLLAHLREVTEAGTTRLTVVEIKNVMLMATAAVTRGLRGSNMMSQLMVNERWHPELPPPKGNGRVYGRTEESRLPATSVRLSRLLAHRNRLTTIEITMLQSRLREQASAVPVLGLVMDPERILLRLPGIRENATDTKMLDIRLDCIPEFSVALESASGCRALARSPIAIREAVAPGRPFADLRGDFDEQFNRLWQTLHDGTYSLSGYNIQSSDRQDLPGMFHCSLASPFSGSTRTKSEKPPTKAPARMPPPAPAAVMPVPAAPLVPESAPPPVEIVPQSGTVFPFNHRLDELPQRPMKMILITAGSGGTGKSTIARLLYELAGFESRDDVAMFDCDALGNRDFQKIAPEKIESMPIDNVDSMRRMVETAMEGKLVLADLPASCQDILARDLNPEIIQSLREDDGLHWLPIHPVTAKAATLPAIKQWRTSVFGDAPAIIVVSLKDGPVPTDVLDEIVRPQDMVLRIPVLDQSLASALDASNATWQAILDGKAPDSHRMFGNPLVKRQLRFKRKECEDALFPLLRRIVKDAATAG